MPQEKQEKIARYNNFIAQHIRELKLTVGTIIPPCDLMRMAVAAWQQTPDFC